MSETRIPKAILRMLGQVAKGTVEVAVAGKKLGQYLDKKLGTDDKSAFPVKKGYRPATGKKKSLIGD